jgi:hypothetical protein
MKTKPNTEQFEYKDPDDFLNGGTTADVVTSSTASKLSQSSNDELSKKPRRIHREQKIFRLPLTLIDELKRESYERSMKAGCRITETEIVEQALKTYLKL